MRTLRRRPRRHSRLFKPDLQYFASGYADAIEFPFLCETGTEKDSQSETHAHIFAFAEINDPTARIRDEVYEEFFDKTFTLAHGLKLDVDV